MAILGAFDPDRGRFSSYVSRGLPLSHDTGLGGLPAQQKLS
ncbi:hypothetical protein N6L24_04040 [Cognatishimia sp. SS12]|nr:hypothetical protein [Cognatishimia sp. SS12]